MSAVVDHNVIKQTYCTASTGMCAECHSSSASFISPPFFLTNGCATPCAIRLIKLSLQVMGMDFVPAVVMRCHAVIYFTLPSCLLTRANKLFSFGA